MRSKADAVFVRVATRAVAAMKNAFCIMALLFGFSDLKTDFIIIN